MKRVDSYLRLHAPQGSFLVANWRGVLGLFSLLLIFLLVRPRSGHIQASRLHIEPAELLMVQAVFRHGARTPLSTLYWPETSYTCKDAYPGVRMELFDETGQADPPPILDLNMPKLPGGCRMGQLTQTGYHMALDLGAWLRHRYTSEMEFLSPTFEEGQVSVRSTCIQRAVQTLQGVASGLWPDLASDAGGHGLKVNASREAREFMYGKNTTCKALTPLYAALQEGIAERDARDGSLAQLALQVADALELEGGAPSISWLRLHDTIAAIKAEFRNHSAILPPQLTPALTHEIFRQAVLHEAPVLAPLPRDGLLPVAQCTKTVRLAVGPLLWRLSSNMQRAWAEVLHSHAAKPKASSIASSTATRAKTGGMASTATEAGDATKAGPEHRKLSSSLRHRVLRQGGGTHAHGMHASAVGRALLSGRGGLRGTSLLPHHITSAVSQAGVDHTPSYRIADLDAMHEHAIQRRHLAQQLESPVSYPHAYLYSGHDSTITPLLAALGQPETAWPPFTASIVFELWSTHGVGRSSVGGAPRNVRAGNTGYGEPAVRVLYNRVPLEMDGPGTSPGGFITLSALTEKWRLLASDDDVHARECALPAPAAERPEQL